MPCPEHPAGSHGCTFRWCGRACCESKQGIREKNLQAHRKRLGHVGGHYPLALALRSLVTSTDMKESKVQSLRCENWQNTGAAAFCAVRNASNCGGKKTE